MGERVGTSMGFELDMWAYVAVILLCCVGVIGLALGSDWDRTDS